MLYAVTASPLPTNLGGGCSRCWLVICGGVCGLMPVVGLPTGAVMQAQPAIRQTGALDRVDAGRTLAALFGATAAA